MEAAILVEGAGACIDNSRCGSLAIMDVDNELGCMDPWGDFSPAVDWGAMCSSLSDGYFDLHGLVESMVVLHGEDRSACQQYYGYGDMSLQEVELTTSSIGGDCGGATSIAAAVTSSYSRSTISSYGDGEMSMLGGEEELMSHQENLYLSNMEEEQGEEEEEEMLEEEEEDSSSKGLKLVHLLMAAAEALTGAPGMGSRELARVILVRLKELVSPTAATNIERLAAYFTEALQGLLDGCCGASGTAAKQQQQLLGSYNGCNTSPNRGDVLAAFQLLQDMSPYVKFGHFTANQAILEAASGPGVRRLHIIDYDIMEGIQWASLMQALVSRSDNGTPPPHLRITAIVRSSGGSGGGGGRSNRSTGGAGWWWSSSTIGTVQETGRRLAAFAASIGQPFSFGQCRLDPDDNFRPSSGLKLVKGETLVVNCMLHLPHLTASRAPPDSVAAFLSAAKTLNPQLITLVEEEPALAAPIQCEGSPADEPSDGAKGFVARFMDSLYQYSAVCDSLEAGFPMQQVARVLVERVFLVPRIAGAVSRLYRGWGGSGSWADWMDAQGHDKVPISFFNLCQARLLVGLFNDGFRVEETAPNRLVLNWKSRRLITASVWSSCSHATSTATTPTPSTAAATHPNIPDVSPVDAGDCSGGGSAGDLPATDLCSSASSQAFPDYCTFDDYDLMNMY